MSNLDRMDRTFAARRRELRRAERDDLMRIIGDDHQGDTPDATVIAASSRDSQDAARHDTRPHDPRSCL
jgi:hypothetical protein